MHGVLEAAVEALVVEAAVVEPRVAHFQAVVVLAVAPGIQAQSEQVPQMLHNLEPVPAAGEGAGELLEVVVTILVDREEFHIPDQVAPAVKP